MSRITVFLRGGLGNQMFQYALGLHLAKKNNNNAELVLDTTFLNDRFPRKEFTYRTFDLDVFTLKPHLSVLSKISEKLPVPGLWLGLDIAFLMVKKIFGLKKIIKEKNNYVFESEVLSAKGDIVLWGFWQSEKYFADIAPDIRKAFSFREELSGEAAVIAEEIKNKNSVSLHVRRGDYVKFEKVKKMVGDTNLSYYAATVSYIAERVNAPHFFVFSDDIEWCEENLKISFPVTYLDEKTAGPKNAYHLELMSLCKHNIIANSAFSWWGAWLNKNPEKIVVAQKKWYATTLPHEEDIVPEAWIRI
ncbi:MAG: alpha-1,2-fucosyltransferase [Candidatus Liptonbacteria bacterium]|nr:alpha-1,2-fucosyltransferase [Candidatus Liptonbacteria bacterium]